MKNNVSLGLREKKQQQDHGYGPWAFLVDNKFAGWGGLQYENGDADLALVLHPQYWGFSKKIFNEIIRRAFNEMWMESITILFPPLQEINLKGFIYQDLSWKVKLCLVMNFL